MDRYAWPLIIEERKEIYIYEELNASLSAGEGALLTGHTDLN